MLQIRAIGGHGEVGRNCTAVRYNDTVVILDMGLHIENYISLTEDEDVVDVSTRLLIDSDAVPNIHLLKDWKNLVKGIFLSHAHLDHVGAVPFLANRFHCPVVGAPFTIEVVKALVKDQRKGTKNELVPVPLNKTYKVTEEVSVEFVSITHSIPHSALLVVHTPEGQVVYGNDFKIDNQPLIGEQPNWKRVKELRPKVFVSECLYAPKATKTPSERVAREMLRDVLLGTDTTGKNIVVTTFSSHIARLKSIVELAKTLKRIPVFLGRSLDKYTTAAEAAGIVDFTKGVERVKYSSKVKDYLARIRRPEDYLFIATGNQGEPKAILYKMVNKGFFKWNPEDLVVFSCITIPTETNRENRHKLETDLKFKKVRYFKDVHVSGHAAREDLRDMINWLKPEILIPSHGDKHMMDAFADLADEMGFRKDQIKPLRPGKTWTLD